MGGGQRAQQPACGGARPPRYEIEARVVAHVQLLENEFELVFEAPEIARSAQPGQFVELTYGDGVAPLTRRPFSLYHVDRSSGACRILYRSHGSFTSGLKRMCAGDSVNVLGPLGRPFSWPRRRDARHILIAGGIGAPPIYFLAREICATLEAGSPAGCITVVNAARTRDLLIGLAEFEALDARLHAVTDDGSHGRQGLATELLELLLDEGSDGEEPAQVYACGPMAMLRALAGVALSRSAPCQVSIETSMPCGTGVCRCCAVRVWNEERDAMRYALACVEGPVFDARSLVW
jgi:dihydroorotate dehydrogenase electron transfer subunit